MAAKVAVVVFPGSNSEDETLRALTAVGLDARLVRSDDGGRGLQDADGYVMPGGFAYEDRIRAGAVAAHDRALDTIIEAAEKGKPVLGICNGAQILVEAGLVPGTGPVRRPTAAFAPNVPGGRFRCVHTYVRLAVAPDRSPLLRGLIAGAVFPAWAAHAEGRLAASFEELARIRDGEHVAFVYATARGDVVPEAVPNGSALGAAGLVNARGNVVALMPHPERDAWGFMHREGPARVACRGDLRASLKPSGGIALFASFARAFDLR
ncbi:MAG: phosphoribosylformylglycinamidine synthase I [Candidatus Eremiobacteraeota bacterium]|nr:phosphoribosylformylglycinamidine synthase I [Candidatus Eremiobacteraeota bacterium]MBV8353891.1 phosphoribosylformylglycinamidine synthase I [Candidatus Eremiobacteraeota bacterium]